MEGYYFSRKLVLFNETFSTPGENGEAVCVLWHECEGGQSAADVSSSYLQYLLEHCDRTNMSSCIPITVLLKIRTGSCTACSFVM